jgi:hypothetical protein
MDHILSSVEVAEDNITIESETGIITFSKFKETPIEHVQIHFEDVLRSQGMIDIDGESFCLYGQYGYNKNLWDVRIIAKHRNVLTLFINKPFVGFIPSKNENVLEDIKEALVLSKKMKIHPHYFFPTNYSEFKPADYYFEMPKMGH